jgi:hypothetical protein
VHLSSKTFFFLGWEGEEVVVVISLCTFLVPETAKLSFIHDIGNILQPVDAILRTTWLKTYIILFFEKQLIV